MYTDTQKYTSSISFNPDVVVMMLGTNDSKAWDKAKSVYKEKYIDLINSYKATNPSVKFILVTSPPAMANNGFAINGTVIKNEILPIQHEIAEELNLPLIDFYDVMENYEGGYASLIRENDGVHLSVEGAKLLADLVEDAIFDVLDSNVVDLVMFMGQSNMAGRAPDKENATKVAPGHGIEFKAVEDPTKLYHVTEPFGKNENNEALTDNNQRGGTLVSALMENYYQETGVPIVGVSAARGGTSVNFWEPGGTALNEAIIRFKAAEKFLNDNGYTIRHKYMVWCQGESDENMAKETYKTKLTAIFNAMFAEGIEDAFVVRIGNHGDDATAYDNIMQAQNELCANTENVVLVFVKFAEMAERDLMKDEWHYYQQAYNEVGEEAGKNMAYYVNNGVEPSFYDNEFDTQYVPNK